MLSIIGRTVAAWRSASALTAATPSRCRRLGSGLPSLAPRALAAASPAFVRCEIRARSFSARAANKCRMNVLVFYKCSVNAQPRPESAGTVGRNSVSRHSPLRAAGCREERGPARGGTAFGRDSVQDRVRIGVPICQRALHGRAGRRIGDQGIN